MAPGMQRATIEKSCKTSHASSTGAAIRKLFNRFNTRLHADDVISRSPGHTGFQRLTQTFLHSPTDEYAREMTFVLD